MTKIHFTIPAPLLGYRASVRRAFDPKYKAYKRRVWALAMEAGWRWREPEIDHPIYLGVTIRWKKAARLDWKNVIGAVEDSLYPRDRYVFPGVHMVSTRQRVEEAIVTVES